MKIIKFENSSRKNNKFAFKKTNEFSSLIDAVMPRLNHIPMFNLFGEVVLIPKPKIVVLNFKK